MSGLLTCPKLGAGHSPVTGVAVRLPLTAVGSVAVLLALLLSACAPTGNQTSPSGTQASSDAESSAPSSSSRQTPLAMPAAGDLFPGTYTPLFEPTITFTVGDAVNLDCAPNYECRGEVDVDEPGWVAVDFGHDHGSELSISRVDALADGTAPPADFAAWIAALPGVSVTDGPTAATIGGLPASRLEFETGDSGVEVGPIPGISEFGAGFPPNSPRLVYVVNVRGDWVLVSVGFDADNTVRNFEETVSAIQPIIDSITWP